MILWRKYDEPMPGRVSGGCEKHEHADNSLLGTAGSGRAIIPYPCPHSLQYSYIADGHHRSASAFRVGEMKIKEMIAAGQTVTGEESFCYFLGVLFPAHQLKIIEYNRAVRDLNGLTKEHFLEKVGEH